ncbi:hypothetical protein PVK06_040035 [Gossypium arboreum]|uniref:RNase H type-1 domain-containing protein n=1 Tax=Gossypium arboreum TaxID=29729 RepID=A0ABR0N538_GOSAR|nr:hypothetical protein PVK06_040035 [Gossypium arboreum]
MACTDFFGKLYGSLIHYRRFGSLLGVWSDITISKEYDHCIDWLEDMMRVLDKRAMADLMVILWNSWNNRNNFIFRGKEEEAKIISERASTLNKEFWICNFINEPLLSQNSAGQKWEKPSKGFIKINFDATVGENKIGYGMIITDDEGFVLGGGWGFIESRLSVEEAECVAFEESIKAACKLKIKEDIIFETDHMGLVNRLRNLANDVTVIGARIKACTTAFNKFNSTKLSWTNQSCNTVAHLICKKMYREAKTCFFEMNYPSEIHNAVICNVT